MSKIDEPIPHASPTPKFLKAQITHASLVLAAAALLREEGPQSVSYRRVAKMAGAASSAVGYYFDSCEELLREAEEYNIQLWIRHADEVACAAESMPRARCRAACPKLLASVCLPDRRSDPIARYLQLISVERDTSIVEEYRKGYNAIAESVTRILEHAGIEIGPRIVMAVADGAAVSALSEELDLRRLAQSLLRDIIEIADGAAHDRSRLATGGAEGANASSGARSAQKH